MIYFILGGVRSGKSKFGMELALKLNPKPVYLATARVWDAEFKTRIQAHQQQRTANWETIEEEKTISRHALHNRVVLVDCITLWLTNYFVDADYNQNVAFKAAYAELQLFLKQDFTPILIANDLGSGVHPTTTQGRHFQDLQGMMNQQIAKLAGQVWQTIAGLTLCLKPQTATPPTVKSLPTEP